MCTIKCFARVPSHMYGNFGNCILLSLRHLYDWSVMFGTNFQTDSKMFDNARELMHDAQTGEHILHSAIRDFKKVPFKENHYDLTKDYTAITNGNMRVELINDESIGYRELKSLLRAENRPMGYTNLSKAQFDALAKQPRRSRHTPLLQKDKP